jgi:hypothetical protein
MLCGGVLRLCPFDNSANHLASVAEKHDDSTMDHGTSGYGN